MPNKALSVTEIAKQAVTDDEILMAKYATPLSVLEFLEDESNFKMLSDVLREALIETGYCTEGQSLSDYISKLQELSREHGLEGYKVERWLSGKTKTIQSRYDAIKICFALKLDRKKSNQFLNKCGHASFSFRNAEDVTFIYCILKGKSYSDAENLYSSFLKAKYKEDSPNDEEVVSHTGDTTIKLLSGFDIKSWETDDDFLDNYLIENKPKFLNYERTALKTYYLWKNEFYFSVLYKDLIAESGYIVIRDELGKQEAKPVRALALNSALAKFSDPDSLLFPAYRIMNNNLANSIAALMKIKQISNQHQDLDSQKVISDFCIDIIKSEQILKHVLSSLELKGSRDTPLFRCVLGFGSNNSLSDLSVGRLPITVANLEMIDHYCRETNSYGFYQEEEGCSKLNKPTSNSIAAKQIYAILQLFEETNLTKEEIESLQYVNYFNLKPATHGYYLYVKTKNIGKLRRVIISERTDKAIKDYLYSSGRGRLRKKSDSSLYDNESLHGSVMKKFPDGKALLLPDSFPTGFGEDLSLRKAFILIYLIYYIYCFSLDMKQDEDFDGMITEFGFNSAFDQLNNLLGSCNISKLYPADAFDWLVMRCLKECHMPNRDSSENDALRFLNKVIAMSYNPERKE